MKPRVFRRLKYSKNVFGVKVMFNKISIFKDKLLNIKALVSTASTNKLASFSFKLFGWVTNGWSDVWLVELKQNK